MRHFKGDNIFFTSDCHYSHKNMCRGVSSWPVENTRDFKTIEEMDSTIVANINKVVGNGLLICLGDWNFGGLQNLPRFRDRLNCDVGLILGNHDNKHGELDDPYINGKRASEYFVFYQHYMECKIADHLFILFHYPIASWNHMRSGAIHLYGHVHSKPEDRFQNGGKSMDVGLDGNGLRPYNVSEVLELMKDRPVKREGHH